jgi:hypothetical protein
MILAAVDATNPPRLHGRGIETLGIPTRRIVGLSEAASILKIIYQDHSDWTNILAGGSADSNCTALTDVCT